MKETPPHTADKKNRTDAALPLPETWPWPLGATRGPGNAAAYIRLAGELRDMIVSGLWKPGMRLPSEREMAAATHLCPNTIKKALNELDTEGLIAKRQGVGSFVSSRISKDKYRYYRLMDDFDSPPPRLDMEVLVCERQKAPERVARCFAGCTNPGTVTSAMPDAPSSATSPALTAAESGPEVDCGDVYRLERCFRVDGKPVIWCCSWLLAALTPNFELLREACVRQPLYSVLEDEYRLPSNKRQELWSVGCAPAAVARLLQVSPQTPLLCSEFIAYTLYDRPFEVRTSYLLTDRYKVFRAG